jgi:hypothetical protein
VFDLVAKLGSSGAAGALVGFLLIYLIGDLNAAGAGLTIIICALAGVAARGAVSILANARTRSAPVQTLNTRPPRKKRKT